MIQIPIIKAVCQVVPDKKICYVYFIHVNLERATMGPRTIILILFDLILYVHSTIFQLCGTGLPGLNQY